MYNNKRCDIIIPVWNQLEPTEACLDSIIRHTRYPYGIIIIDNASDNQTRRFLETFKKGHENVRLIRNEKNVGFIKAVNSGIKSGTADYICVLNNDTLVTDNWLDEMVNVLESDSRIGIVNPSSNNLGQKPKAFQKIDDYARQFKDESGKYVELMACLGFCMLMKRSLINEIGIFDEIYGMGNFEDTDLSFRARQKKYLCVRALGVYVFHAQNASFRILETYQADFENNKKIFEKRWGKQKRCLFIFFYKTSYELFSGRINNLVNGNNWIFIAIKNIPAAFKIHSNIKIYQFKRLFIIGIVFKIIFKKKKFDEIYCDSKKLTKALQILRPIHKSMVSHLERT